MQRADVFVVYDDVQYDTHGWRNRNRIKTQHGPRWLTVPVRHRGLGKPCLLDVSIDSRVSWARKHVTSMRQAYARAPYVDDHLPVIEEILTRAWNSLVDLNLTLANALAGMLGENKVLVATSVWGRPQLQRLGTDVPVYPHRAEMAFFQVPDSDKFQLSCIVTDARSMLYLRPEGDRQMYVGWREGDRIHTTEDLVTEDPDNYQQTAHFATVTDMHRRLAMTLPPMADGFVHRTYACVYDYTPDGMPILERSASVEGLYFAVGFSGGGFSLSPWVGRSMAEFIVGEKRPPQIECFDLARFDEGRAFHWSNVDTRRNG